MNTIVQISLDLVSIPEALETARMALRAGVDWLEAGTPLIIVGSLVGQSAHSRQPQVDGCWRELPGFQLIAVSQNDRATEGQSGFGAVPSDEVIDSESVGAFRGDRAKALQN